MDDKTPIDGEYGLDYQIFIMRKMISALPPDTAKHFDGQLDSIIEAIKNRFNIVKEVAETNLDDARVAVKNLEFDLFATRRERDDLQERLDESS